MPKSKSEVPVHIKAAAELERRRREKEYKMPSLLEWLETVSPKKQWDAAHLLLIMTYLERMNNGELKKLMLFLPPRHGKCLAKGTLITMGDGTCKPIEDVVVGDEVATMGVDGELVNNPVLDCQDNGVKPVIKITFKSGRKLICTTNHRLFTIQGWQEAGQVFLGHAVAVPCKALPWRVPMVLWDRIEKMAPDGYQQTYDLSVQDIHNFLANGIVVHNSELVTMHYPAYYLEKFPYRKIIIASYGSTLAEKFSKTIRTIVRDRNKVELDMERQAVQDWVTKKGGGVRAVGAGGSVTGLGGHLVIIDDPVKSSKEADSKIIRDKTWEWYSGDLYTRLEPDVNMILIMTRWHEDDIAGRILASEDGPNWEVINLPALALEDDPLGRLPGEALWPDRFDEERLLQIKTVQGIRKFDALYQQMPHSAEGSMFDPDWFDIIELSEVPAEVRIVRFWDFAATENATSDYSSGALLAEFHGVWYLLDIQHAQKNPLNLETMVKETAFSDGFDISIHIEQEGGSGGKITVDSYKRHVLVGYEVHHFAVQGKGSKITRAGPFSSAAESRNFKLVKGKWNNKFLEEVASFPQGAHDDMVDSVTGAMYVLSHGSGSIVVRDYMKEMAFFSKYPNLAKPSGFYHDDSCLMAMYHQETNGVQQIKCKCVKVLPNTEDDDDDGGEQQAWWG